MNARVFFLAALTVAGLGSRGAVAADACTKTALGQCCSAGSQNKVTHSEKNGIAGLASASGKATEINDYSIMLRNACNVPLRIALSHKCNMDNTGSSQVVDVPPGGRTLGLFGLKPDCKFSFDEVGATPVRAPDVRPAVRR